MKLKISIILEKKVENFELSSALDTPVERVNFRNFFICEWYQNVRFDTFDKSFILSTFVGGKLEMAGFVLGSLQLCVRTVAFNINWNISFLFSLTLFLLVINFVCSITDFVNTTSKV